jgi:hypothetical protein
MGKKRTWVAPADVFPCANKIWWTYDGTNLRRVTRRLRASQPPIVLRGIVFLYYTSHQPVQRTCYICLTLGYFKMILTYILHALVVSMQPPAWNLFHTVVECNNTVIISSIQCYVGIPTLNYYLNFLEMHVLTFSYSLWVYFLHGVRT